MINQVVFPNDTHFMVPVSTLSASVIISETLAYPLLRLNTLKIMRSYSKVGYINLIKSVLILH